MEPVCNEMPNEPTNQEPKPANLPIKVRESVLFLPFLLNIYLQSTHEIALAYHTDDPISPCCWTVKN